MTVKFLADTMLGRLATWLRLLGYDSAYLPNADDPELVRVARAEGRILLTRDVELTRRRGLQCVLVESERVEEQVQQIFRVLKLSPRESFSRCAVCNCVLEDVSRESVRDAVPPYVYHTQERLRRCPCCERVYWRGTHWAHMFAQIEDLNG